MQDFVQAVITAIKLVGSFDPEIVGIVALSLSVSLSASVIALVIGAPLGGVLAVSHFWGRQVVIVLANALLGYTSGEPFRLSTARMRSKSETPSGPQITPQGSPSGPTAFAGRPLRQKSVRTPRTLDDNFRSIVTPAT
jgi:hypothetical protein